MANIEQLFGASDFSQGWWVDWADDPNSDTSLATGHVVSGVPNFYRVSPTDVTINETGPQASLRYCSSSDFECNFWAGDAMLTAADPSATASQGNAPLRLKFSNPLSAVGTFVSGAAGTNGFGTPFAAVMWIRLSGKKTWEAPITTGGVLDGLIMPGGTPTAPFVGARSTNGKRIAEVCFDVALLGNLRFQQVAISELYGIS